MTRFLRLLIAISVAAFFAVTNNSFASQPSVFYVTTNKADGNTVVGFKADKNGSFEVFGEFSTGGLGTGDLEVPELKKNPEHPLANGDDPLISANAIAGAGDGQFVLTVNPGNGTIALLKVRDDNTLQLINTVPASDKFPVSIAASGETVAVASVGLNNMSGSVATYRLAEGGLVPVENGRRDLNARPSTIAFSSNGKYVVVDELVTGKIKVFDIYEGILSIEPVSMIESPREAESRFQAIPVGFAVHKAATHDVILVSEARFLTPDFKLREEKGVVPQSPYYSWQTGSVSTYSLTADGVLAYLTKDALTGAQVEGGEIANCWVAVSNDGKILFAANALSSSISTFDILESGEVELRNATAFKDAGEELFFSDMAVSADGSQLYQLVGNKGQVMIFAIGENGTLTHKQTVAGLPELGAYGLLAR